MALKVSPTDTKEALILKHLSRCSHVHPGSNHVMKLLDHFVIRSPEKSFDGLVLELFALTAFDRFQTTASGKLSKDEARRASIQASKGLAYLHQMKVAHGGW